MKKRKFYLTLGRRFIILSSVTFLIPLIMFSIFASRNFSEALNLKLQQMTDSSLGLIDKNIDYIINDVESTANLISTNQFTQALLLEEDVENRYTLDYRQKEITVINLLINTTNNKDFLETVYLGNQFTALKKNKSSIGSEKIENYQEIAKTQWYQELVQMKGKGCWYQGSDIPGFSNNLLVYAKSVLYMNNPRPIGILLVGIGEFPFSNIFTNQQVDFSSKILISQNDQIIYDYTPEDDDILQGLSKDEEKSLILKDGIVDGKSKVYVRHIYNQSSGWKITSIVPYKIFFAEKKSADTLIFGIAGLCFFIGVFLMSVFSQSITHTLKQLSSYVHSLREGEKAESISFSTKDDIGLIGNELVRVVSENQSLMENLYQSMVREKEAELMVLQTQINPHFLYNTLDAIFWIAKEYQAVKVEKMVIALSKVFKLSLNKGQKFSTIGQEIDLVENYLYIQKMRFGNGLHTVIDTPEELRDEKILKFILQPLIENSIQHGLADKKMAGTIKISVSQELPYLFIIVEDDGMGFSCPFEEAVSNGYALKNIQERLQLYYGEDCGLSLDTRLSDGTRIIVKMKKMNP